MATIPASAIADTHASIIASDINNGDGRAQIVVNELLSFIAYKLQLMAPDTIVQLCASFFSEADIARAKVLLFELCADQDDREDRMIKRASGPKKKQLSLKDIVSLFTRKHDAITARVTFVAVDLGKLPPIGYNSLDVCTLLSQLQTTISELETVKVTVAAQAVTCTELRSSVAMQGGLCVNLRDAVVSLVAKSNEVGATPEAMTSVSLPVTTDDVFARMMQQPVNLPRAGISFATAASGTVRNPEWQTATTTTAASGTGRNPEWRMVFQKRRRDAAKLDKGRPDTAKTTTNTTRTMCDGIDPDSNIHNNIYDNNCHDVNIYV